MTEPYKDSEGDEGTPRWVKAFGIVFVVLALLFIILHLAGGPRLHGGHTGGDKTPPGGNGVRP